MPEPEPLPVTKPPLLNSSSVPAERTLELQQPREEGQVRVLAETQSAEMALRTTSLLSVPESFPVVARPPFLPQADTRIPAGPPQILGPASSQELSLNEQFMPLPLPPQGQPARYDISTPSSTKEEVQDLKNAITIMLNAQQDMQKQYTALAQRLQQQQLPALPEPHCCLCTCASCTIT